MFQSTRPRGARPTTSATTPAQTTFQSTRPRGARPRCYSNQCAAGAFQSTRPRGARRFPARTPTRRSWRVSIHAPARGATHRPRRPPRSLRVSIHAPARGATHRQTLKSLQIQFQSTRPRGARPPTDGQSARMDSFNPRAREGRDDIAGSA